MTSKTILIVDDEEVVRRYVKLTLRKEGFDLLDAADGLDALQQIELRGGPIDLLLTDVRMPRMDGIALASSAIEKDPGIRVLFMSGFSFDLRDERTKLAPAACAFLAKPFTRQALLEAIRGLLDTGRRTSGAAG